MFTNELSIGHKVIDTFDKKDLDAIEIYFSYNNSKQLTINGKSISTQRAKEEMGAGIRIIKNECMGYSFTNILTEESLINCANEALTIAKNSPPIKDLCLPETQKYGDIKGIYNKDLADLSVDILAEDGLAYIDGFSGIDSRVKSVLSGITLSTSGNAILNSNGVEATQQSTFYEASLMAIASDKDKSGAYVFDTVFERDHSVDMKAIGEKLGQKAIDNLNQETIKSFEGEIIFEAPAMFNPIGVVIGLAVSADRQQRGTSFWKDKLAAKVIDEKITFIDKPHDLQGGHGVRIFDDEGTATQETEIIKNGVLQTFLHDQRTAAKEGLTSTGNALRQGAQPFMQPPLVIFPNSPWIKAGDMSKEELIETTKKGLIINNYQGTLRPENGVFSGVAKGAYFIENGEIVKPVTGISISGNVFDILNKVTGVGKDYHLANNHFRTPIVRFSGITISTK
ncbi:MAG: TldD/PmbA family protein [Asgard group archaeon]|nr:TldD/PmbA family protein [Asgard group archaeon]